MNGLAWFVLCAAIRATAVLVPAVFLYRYGLKRGPEAAAWVALSSLGLVLVVTVALLVPAPRRDMDYANPREPSLGEERNLSRSSSASTKVDTVSDKPSDHSITETLVDWSRPRLIKLFETIQQRTRQSAFEYRQVMTGIALLIVTGSVFGLLRLFLAVGSIRLWRERSQLVADAGLRSQLDGIQQAMGWSRTVELRESPEVGTAATACWRRPVILLPCNWRSWDRDERGAVLAHEMAHIVRGDYLAGLFARVVLALHFYNPLARWLTGQLLMQQELAADSLGARFSGGTESYLLALSRHALRQDRQTMRWPARAFVPPRGTLIRRIAMLTKEEGNTLSIWTVRNRLSTSVLLAMIAIGALAMPIPTGASDDTAPKDPNVATASVKQPIAVPTAPAIDLSYLPSDSKGFIAFQPAAICRREGMSGLVSQMQANPRAKDWLWLFLMDFNLFPTVGEVVGDKDYRSNCEFRIEEVEQISADFDFDQVVNKGEKYRRIRSHCHTIRMINRFDWEKQARIWWPKATPVNELRKPYYKINSPLYGAVFTAYFPDDRTMVLGTESEIREIIQRDTPSKPRFLEGLDWKTIQHGLFVIALDNHDRRLAGVLKKETGKDAVDLSRMFENADLWAFYQENSDRFGLQSFATCANREESGPLQLATQESLLEMKALTLNVPTGDGNKEPRSPTELQKLFAKILEGYTFESSARSISAIPRPTITLADFFSVMGRMVALEASAHEESRRAE